MQSRNYERAAQLIVASVCARGGSKGIPRKALRLLQGHPLVGRAVLCARQTSKIERVVVSTDDEDIAQVARQYGAEVPFIRPLSLAQDESPKWDVFRHLVESFEIIVGRRIEILVDLDVSVPLRTPATVSACVNALQASAADIVVTAYQADRNPYFNMVELDAEGNARIVKPSLGPVHNRQAAAPVFALSPAVYAIRRDVLWRCQHWSEARMRVHVLPREEAWDADSELDFRIIRFLMREGRHEV